MPTGFVLIRTMPKMEHNVFNGLMGLKQVSEVYNVFGECDIVAKVIAEDYQAIGDIVVDIIRSTKGIVWTKTLVTCALDTLSTRDGRLRPGGFSKV